MGAVQLRLIEAVGTRQAAEDPVTDKACEGQAAEAENDDSVYTPTVSLANVGKGSVVRLIS